MSSTKFVGALALAWMVTVTCAHAGDSTTMKGSYVTVGEYPDTGKIEAVFTPADEGLWSVVCRFDFQDGDYVFNGTAAGSLSNGPLAGTVKNENGKRTFTFRGVTTDGRFEGTHAEVEFGGETPTGSMTLEVQPQPTGP